MQIYSQLLLNLRQCYSYNSTPLHVSAILGHPKERGPLLKLPQYITFDMVHLEISQFRRCYDDYWTRVV
jgi:hypothetical protein